MRSVPLEHLLGLVTFATVTCFTPGPNNAMLMASGLNFGISRTRAHVLGVTLGFAFMVLAVGLGIGQLLASSATVYTAMKLVAVAYLLWLAWGIANASSLDDGRAGGRPLTFLEACAFQWINPKGWIMAVGATTTYAIAGSRVASAALVAAVFGVVGLASSASWASFGAAFRGLLATPRRLRAVNILLAVLLVASLYPVFVELAGALRLR